MAKRVRPVPNPILEALSSFELCLVTLYGEARGEPIEGQIAVANVFRNRLDAGRWGVSYHTVLLGWAQFSCLWPTLGGKNYEQVLEFAQRVGRGARTQDELQMRWVVDGLFARAFADNTKGATHYYSPEAMVPRNSRPAWADTAGSRLTVAYGRHLFYAGVR